jgi:FkbM family methyltransferase
LVSGKSTEPSGQEQVVNLLQRIARSDSPKLERPFLAFCGYVLQKASLSDYINLQRSQYAVPFFAKSNIALNVWTDPTLVDRAEEFTRAYLKPGDTLIDAGANIGCITAAGALAVGKSGRVLSVEPHPQTFRHLQKTIAVNRFANVDCLNGALGSEIGTVSFTDKWRKDDSNRVSHDNRSGIQVPCLPLTKLMHDRGIDHVALLKVDVEGFEMQVLKGAEDVLSRIDCLYVEVLDHLLRMFGSSASEVIAFLRSHGFSCHRFRDDESNVVAFSADVSPARWQQELALIST